MKVIYHSVLKLCQKMVTVYLYAVNMSYYAVYVSSYDSHCENFVTPYNMAITLLWSALQSIIRKIKNKNSKLVSKFNSK